MQINNETVEKIGKGWFATAYRSIDNPNNVYLVVAEYDLVREMYSHIDDGNRTHFPKMQNVGEMRHNGKMCNIYLTEFSNKLTKKEYPKAYTLYKKIVAHYENTKYYNNSIDYHLRIQEFMENVENDATIDDNFKFELSVWHSWATAYGSDILLDLTKGNVGVSNNGDLILRDFTVFETERKAYKRDHGMY